MKLTTILFKYSEYSQFYMAKFFNNTNYDLNLFKIIFILINQYAFLFFWKSTFLRILYIFERCTATKLNEFKNLYIF